MAVLNDTIGYGTGDGEFRYPFGVTADPAGDLYVSDARNMRIRAAVDHARARARERGTLGGCLPPPAAIQLPGGESHARAAL